MSSYPGALQATRALMIVSIIVTVAGLGVACMGMKCTNCGGDDKTKKSRIAMTGGIIILIGCKTPLFELVFVSRPSVSLTPETVSVTFCFALLAALCSIVACSWYAHDIIQAFYNPFTPVNTK